MELERFYRKSFLFIYYTAKSTKQTFFLDTDDGLYLAIMREGSPVEIRAGYRPEGQSVKYRTVEDLPDDVKISKMVQVYEKKGADFLGSVKTKEKSHEEE